VTAVSASPPVIYDSSAANATGILSTGGYVQQAMLAMQTNNSTPNVLPVANPEINSQAQTTAPVTLEQPASNILRMYDPKNDVDETSAFQVPSTTTKPATKAEDKKKARSAENTRDKLRDRVQRFVRAWRTMRAGQMSGRADARRVDG
jgi:hypothetical protein